MKYLPILFVALFIFSCNGQRQSNVLNVEKLDSQNHEKSVDKKANPVKYGAGDIVTDACLDQSGNLWFTTTNEGIFKYNGKRFTNLTQKDGLCSNEVWAVIESQEGLLWFATAKGLCSYDGATFVNLPLPQEDVAEVSPKTGYPSRTTETVSSLTQDSKGNFWIGTDASGAYRYDGKSFTSFLKFEGRLQADNRYNNCITNIIEDRKGNIWFSSMTHGGISRYDGESMTHFTTSDGLLGDMITASFEDAAGNIWFGSIQNLDGGLMRYDGKSFESYTPKDGLCDSNVACIYQEENGIIWIGTGDGICYFDGQTFTNFDNDGQSFGDIRFIIKDTKNNLWFGGRYGVLWQYDGNELKDFTQKKKRENEISYH